VGIDDLNIYGSTLAVEFAEIAVARGFSAQELHAARFQRRSLLPPYEDPITLAVNAAKPLVDAAGPESFELVIVATETGVDYGKPLSSYVHRHLGLGARCWNLEAKHGCYSGTAALQLAAAWVRTNADAGKKALVVMTDVGRRHFGRSAELTSGAGAVALSVARTPRVLEIEADRGYGCKEVYDVARPTPTGEVGDAVLSLYAFLDLLELAWENYRSSVAGDLTLENRFRYMLYHAPLISLVEHAHRVLIEMEREDATPTEIRQSFDRMVGPALRYAQELGNTYTANVYTLLAGLIDAVPTLEAGTRVGVFSYGSGSCAEIYGGVVQAEARATLAAHRIGESLAARRKVAVEPYEALVMESERCLASEQYAPDREFLKGHFEEYYRGRGLLVLDGVENYYRRYVWS
jgi:3-hydroxy-3-methylglutaryl CoA synthase